MLATVPKSKPELLRLLQKLRFTYEIIELSDSNAKKLVNSLIDREIRRPNADVSVIVLKFGS
jgi:hypothetical protein